MITVDELKKWLNPIYVEAFRQNEIAKYKLMAPFEHVVLENFFNEASITRILKRAAEIPKTKSHQKGLTQNTDWYWGAYSDLDFLKFYFGPSLREFLNQLLGKRLRMKADARPQLNEFRPGSKGIGVHTDLHEKVGVVSLIQLSHGYQPGLGGELIFYRREGNQILEDTVVTPVCNKLILFQVSEKSFHGVRDMKGNWTRRTITCDWLV